jgi:hypothetical protein
MRRWLVKYAVRAVCVLVLVETEGALLLGRWGEVMAVVVDKAVKTGRHGGGDGNGSNVDWTQ